MSRVGRRLPPIYACLWRRRSAKAVNRGKKPARWVQELVRWTLVMAGLAMIAGAVWWQLGPGRPAAGTGATSGRDAKGQSNLHVRVVGPQGEPAAGATVQLDAVGQTHTQTTDSQGLAQFRGLAPGRAELVVEARAMARSVRSLELGASNQQLRIALSPGALLKGLAVDDEGSAVAGAAVRVEAQAQPPVRPWVAKTDAKGAFVVETLVPGVYSVEVTAEGHETSVLPEVRVPSDRPVRISVQRTSSISGKVQDSSGQSVDTAVVVVAGSGIWPPRKVKVGSGGTFEISGLPGGIYELRARAGTAVSEPKEGLLVEPGTPQSVVLRLAPGAALKGQVLDAETEKPLAGAEVTVAEESLSFTPMAVKTAEDGSFRVAGLRKRSHRVSIRYPGYVPVVGQEREPGDQTHTFGLRRAAVIAGAVVDERGEPVSGAHVELVGTTETGSPLALSAGSVAFSSALFETQLEGPLPLLPSGELGVTHGAVPPIPASARTDPPSAASSAAAASRGADLSSSKLKEAKAKAASRAVADGFVSDQQGRFRIAGVPPGTVQVLVRRSGYAPSTSEPRTIAPGSTVPDFRIVLSRGGKVEGRVVDERDFPVSGVRVELHAERETFPRLMISEADGTFQFGGVYGATVVTAYPPGLPPTRVNVEVGSGKTRHVELVLRSQAHTLTGITSDMDGFPIQGVLIQVRSLDAASPVTVTTRSASDGRFSVAGLPKPPYSISADHPDYAPLQLGPVSSVERELAIELQAGVPVRGRAMDEWRGGPVQGAQITLLDRRGGRRLETRTNARGEFGFRNVTSGDYTALVSKPGYLAERVPVVVRPDRRRMDAVELQPVYLSAGGSVTGEVVDRSGNLVSGAEVAMGDPPEWEKAVRTDRQGAFRHTGVPPGNTAISARHPTAGISEMKRMVRVFALQETPGILVRLPERFIPDTSSESEDERQTGVAAQLTWKGGAVTVSRVVRGSKAQSAGLKVGDILLSVNGAPVKSVVQGRGMLLGPAGVEVELEVQRGPRTRHVLVAREHYALE